MTDQQIGLFDALYTQRAIRSLKPDPVPEALLHRMVEAATKAPSGGNSQPWAFIVVRDMATIAKIAEYAKRGFAPVYEAALGRMKPGDPPPFPRLKPLVESFERVPAIVFPAWVRPANAQPGAGGASLYPATQNLLLAARGLGLGAAMTSIALGFQKELKELLGVPEHVELMATIPVGYPNKERYGKTTRKPAHEVTHWDRWGNQHPAPAGG